MHHSLLLLPLFFLLLLFLLSFLLLPLLLVHQTLPPPLQLLLALVEVFSALVLEAVRGDAAPGGAGGRLGVGPSIFWKKKTV